MFVSRRVTFVHPYSKTEDDEIIYILSSKGNEALQESHKELIEGSDVVAALNVNFFSFKPKLDSCGDLVGTELTQVYSFNPNGTIPSMAVDLLIKKQQEGLIMITN